MAAMMNETNTTPTIQYNPDVLNKLGVVLNTTFVKPTIFFCPLPYNLDVVHYLYFMFHHNVDYYLINIRLQHLKIICHTHIEQLFRASDYLVCNHNGW